MVDRMISMGIMASGVAHEINNPNTFILTNAQLLDDAWKNMTGILDSYCQEKGDFRIGKIAYSDFKNSVPTVCARIIDGSRRIKRIVEELRHFSRKDSKPVTQQLHLNEVIRSAEILLANMIKNSTHNFVKELDETIPCIRGSSQRLEQVVINILQNSCQALTDPSQQIFISTSFDSSTGEVILICRDQGVGINEKELKYVYDPFFTTKRETGGSGLGLSISSTIVSEHQGSMDTNSISAWMNLQ